MSGKICLVTGATAGIGRVTAGALAVMGAQVVVAGRSPKKAEETVREIRARAGNPSVDVLLADFSDLDQVRSLASAFRSRYPRLDVLVNNAGAFFYRRLETPYGVEMTFMVNHLAHFLLTRLLLDAIQAAPSARIVNVSSNAHVYDDMDFDDLGFKRGYSGMKAYARSKLANILFTFELARRLADGRIPAGAGSSAVGSPTANALHPGHVATDIWRTNIPLIGPAIKWVMGFIALTPEQGADNSIYLASSPEVAGLTGKYFVERKAVSPSPAARNEEVARKLWDLSQRLTGAD